MANTNNWGEIYKSTWWGDKAWSANTLFIDSAPPGFGLNLLKASEDMDNTRDWLQKTGATVSAQNTNDPNGELTAERVDFIADQYSRIQQLVTLEASTTYTFSVHAKVPSGSQDFRMRVFGVSGATGSFTALSSDWTRFDFDFTTTTAGTYTLAIMNAEDGAARSIQFWGAMLNEGADVGGYVKTEASVGGSSPTPEYSGFGDEFVGVTAYYSLRQFTEAETLNAIRVRRSSDDTEQDIGFDANGDLDTTALTTFVNADVDTYTSDFSSTEDLIENNGTGAAAQSVGGVSDAYKFTTITGTGQMFARPSASPFSGKGGSNSFRVQADVYLPSTNAEIDGIRIWTGHGTEIFSEVTTTDSWVSVDQTLLLTQGSDLYFSAKDGANLIPTTTGANVFYLKNIVVTQTTADGAVTTWYDQTGNGNDATNATESEQPLVVSGGTLVEENSKAAVDFDGVDDVLTLPASIGTPFTGQGKAISSFSVSSIVSDNRTLWSITGASNDDYYFSSHDGTQFKFFARGSGGTLKSSTSSSTFGAGQYLKADILPEEAASVQNGDMYIDGTQEVTSFDYATAIKTLDRGGGIGALVRGSVSGNFNGKHQEIILFDSDQSANLGTVTTGGGTLIQGNINTYFDIV